MNEYTRAQRCCSYWQGCFGEAFQWVSWQWAVFGSILLACDSGFSEALLCSASILLSESLLTWSRQPREPAPLSGCDCPVVVLPNSLAGLAFYHIDHAVTQSSYNSLLSRCLAVGVGDGFVHYLTSFCLKLNQVLSERERGKRRFAALGAAVNAVAYTLAVELSTAVAPYREARSGGGEELQDSVFIFATTAIASKILAKQQQCTLGVDADIGAQEARSLGDRSSVGV